MANHTDAQSNWDQGYLEARWLLRSCHVLRNIPGQFLGRGRVHYHGLRSTAIRECGGVLITLHCNKMISVMFWLIGIYSPQYKN